MMGFQTASASETSAVVLQLITAMADPEAAKSFLASVNDKIDEFIKARDGAMDSLHEAEKKAAEADASLAEAKRISNLNGADAVSLAKAKVDYEARVRDVTDRENALADTAAKINTDFQAQREKFDIEKAKFENFRTAAIAATKTERAALDSLVEKTKADIAQKLNEIADLKAKAVSDAAIAADLKAMWEGKVKAFNTLAQSLTTSVPA